MLSSVSTSFTKFVVPVFTRFDKLGGGFNFLGFLIGGLGFGAWRCGMKALGLGAVKVDVWNLGFTCGPDHDTFRMHEELMTSSPRKSRFCSTLGSDVSAVGFYDSGLEVLDTFALLRYDMARSEEDGT